MPSKDKIIKQHGFKTTWERQETKSTDLDNDFHCMREWQEKAFNMLKNAPHMIINAPMGSGKSWMICMLSAYKLIQNNTLRCIICIPQTIIAPGFANAKLQLPDGSRIHWQPKHNLCNSEKGTVDYVIRWLKRNPNSFNDRMLLCTHATIVAVYTKLKQENRLDLLLNLLCWIDEAHHVKNCLIKGSNAIGTMVSYFINNTSNGTEIGLTTATFFRGDRSRVLFPDQEKLFEKYRYDLPYDEYLESMEHLKSFSFDFILCGQDYSKAIEKLIKNNKSKDIIYIPHPMSRHSSGKKLKEVQNIIEIYQKEHSGKIIDSPNGLTLIKNNTSEFKILDLVDQDRINEKKIFIAEEQLQKDRTHLDAIIALNRFKEGANWIWAERSIIVGSRGSLVDVIQMIGRLFRDAKDKEHVKVIQLLPFSLDQHTDDFKENLNNYLKAICALLILEDILDPIKIMIPKNKSEKNESTNNLSKKRGLGRMRELIPDESQQKTVTKAATKLLIQVSAENPNEKNKIVIYEIFQKRLPEVLNDLVDCASHIKEIGDDVYSKFMRLTFNMRGLNVKNIDIDLVQKTCALEGLLMLTSIACGIDTFNQLRNAIQSSSDEYEARWYSNYELVKNYSEQKGHCRIHKNYEIEINKKKVKLGSWYNDQKKNFYNLLKSKQELLEKLPGFILNKFKRNKNLSTDEWINLFIKVSQRLQTPLIPNTYEEKGYKLGQWIQHIRKSEEWKKLSAEQKNLLLNNNFKLFPTTERTEAAILALHKFANKEKHSYPKAGTKTKIIHKKVEYEIRLDNFCNKLRKKTKKIDSWILKKCKTIPYFSLEKIKIQKIDKDYFNKYVEEFQKHTKEKSTPLIYGKNKKNYPELSKWQDYVRKKEKDLDKNFKSKIISIDPYFFFDYRNRLFFHELKPRIEQYMQEYNDAIIPQNYITSDGVPLGEKISNLRGNKNKLKKPIRKYLDSLGNKWAWNCFKQQNIENMQKMISYLESNDYNPRDLPKEIRTLKSKIKKALFKQSSLEQYEKRITELAPGIFDKPKDEHYQELLIYLKREGHACPPIKHIENGKKIGYHVSNIRQKFRKHKLSSDEKIKYESLPGWVWDTRS